jgi:hypothetical protein
MKVLVIPDVHLKPDMFRRAGEILDSHQAEMSVCLMDLADDWNSQTSLALYEETYDAAIAFANEYPDTLWCWGNHDICYDWNQRESGYSPQAADLVREKLLELEMAMKRPGQLTFIHRIDNVLFMHGGLSERFVKAYVDDAENKTMDEIIDDINHMTVYELWNDDSPLWLRPQSGKIPLYRIDEFMQVVGHTPVKQIYCHGNLVSTDVFSTYSDGTNIGTCDYLIVDTVTKRLTRIR